LVPVRAPGDWYLGLYTKKVQSSPYTCSICNSDAIFEVTFFQIWENFQKSNFRIWPNTSPISAETTGKMLVSAKLPQLVYWGCRRRKKSWSLHFKIGIFWPSKNQKIRSGRGRRVVTFRPYDTNVLPFC